MSSSCSEYPILFLLPLLVLALAPVPVSAETAMATEPPVIPVGYDAYRMWDRWAYLRIGQRTYMASTYDRRGANESADASHFLYQLADDRNVTLDVTGPGVLAFKRTNHWHGSPWYYIVDGNEYRVEESSTANPEKPVPNSVFLPEKAFPNPLTWTWSITKGADLMWVPIPFEEWFTLAYGRTHYGTGYYIYHKYLPDAPLTQAIKSWTIDDEPPADVLQLLRTLPHGMDLAEPRPSGSGSEAEPRPSGSGDGEQRTEPLPHGRGSAGTLELGPGEKKRVTSLTDAPATVRALHLRAPIADAAALGEARLRITWDGASEPSVDAPVKLLFGTGSFYNRNNQEYLVKSFPAVVRFAGEHIHLELYFPMPFMKQADIEIEETTGRSIESIDWAIRAEPYTDPPNHVGHFHATYRDHGQPTPGHDLVFLDTREVEGGGDWCGHFVGTSFIFTHRAVLSTLEGDPRFYFDDALTPHAQGTGTEEWGGGGDYWGGRTMTLPFAGHPVGAPKAADAQNEEDLIHSAYRFLLSDLMPFGRNARITFEHGGENESEEHYKSVTFWYGLNQPCLVITDTLHVSDEADERKHAYESPTASPVQTLSSRYEWGVDHLRGKEIFPETADTGRYMKGTTTFRMELEPRNLGVMLRRKFDYAFPNQLARVSVADDDGDAEWHEVGLWYTAGSNTCVYSNPRGELGKTLHIVQTSNRRWRESEFLLPRRLTEGRSAIRIKLESVPRPIRLFPGFPLFEQAWSEYRYTAYCYLMPDAEPRPAEPRP